MRVHQVHSVVLCDPKSRNIKLHFTEDQAIWSHQDAKINLIGSGRNRLNFHDRSSEGVSDQ